jgi:hypothetical protein
VLIRRFDELRATLRTIRWQLGELSADQGPYREILDRLTGLRRVVDAWELFADKLASLAAARDGAGAEGPGLVKHAEQLLHGKQFADLNDIVPTIADAEATAAAVRAWTIDAATVQQLLKIAAQLTWLQGEERTRLNMASAAVEQVREEMRKAADGTEYLSLKVADRLRPQIIEINGLNKSSLVASGEQPPEEIVEQRFMASSLDVTVLRELRESSAATAHRIARTRRLRNGLAFTVIAGVTLWTGLAALYFDQAFGTWRDYVAIAVWGFSAQAGLTVLAGALDRVIATGMVRP